MINRASRSRGSSPRLRGTLFVNELPAGGSGIIPALAGNTIGRASRRTGLWGSSPRLRGTLHRVDGQCHGRGIIPALAGNTPVDPVHAQNSGDHPRACGEHIRHALNRAEQRGSSPRLRGTLMFRWLGNGWAGIIPALAGNTPNYTRMRYYARIIPALAGNTGCMRAIAL